MGTPTTRTHLSCAHIQASPQSFSSQESWRLRLSHSRHCCEGSVTSPIATATVSKLVATTMPVMGRRSGGVWKASGTLIMVEARLTGQALPAWKAAPPGRLQRAARSTQTWTVPGWQAASLFFHQSWQLVVMAPSQMGPLPPGTPVAVLRPAQLLPLQPPFQAAISTTQVRVRPTKLALPSSSALASVCTSPLVATGALTVFSLTNFHYNYTIFEVTILSPV